MEGNGMAWHGRLTPSQLTLTAADDMRQEVPIKGTQACVQ